MKLEFLKDAFPDFEITFEGSDTAVIINPYSDENLTVDYEFCQGTDKSDAFERYTTEFSYQHRHFEEKADVIEWIRDITSGKLVAIEFFRGAKDCFGGEMPFTSISQLTYATFKKHFYYEDFSRYDNFKIRSWSCENDYNGYIKKRENNEYNIVINKV